MKAIKKLGKNLLPILAGLLFILHANWMFWFHLSMLVYGFFLIPIYIFVSIMLLRRHRDGLLATAVGVLLLARMWSNNMLSGMEAMEPAWKAVSAAYLAGTVLLLVLVLFNNIHFLRRFRGVANRLWFVPGVVMLLSVVWCCISTQSYLQSDFLSVRGWILSTFNLFCCPVSDAFATLLIGGWLTLAAEDDLEPYLAMRGNILTEEQFQERKRELGLQRLRL